MFTKSKRLARHHDQPTPLKALPFVPPSTAPAATTQPTDALRS